jgi:hypothetical protein
MVFIEPVKRSSTFKKFTKHENVQVSPDNRFCLQKRKKQGEDHHHNYRIILLGNPYYEVAYSDDINSLKEREWRYIVEEIPRRIPESTRTDKELTPWFLAHFTCLALELGEKIQPDADSDDDHQSTQAIPRAPPTPSLSPLNAGSASMHGELLPLDKPYFSKNAPEGQSGAGFVLPPQSRHCNADSQLYPSSTFQLRGITPLIICMALFNLPMILVREISNESHFSLFMTICNLVIFSIVLFGIPYTVGISRMVPASHFDVKIQPKQQGKQNDANGIPIVNAASPDDNSPVSSSGPLDTTVKPGGATKCSSKGITPAHTLEQSQPGKVAPNTYSDPQGQSWTLRCGPNYASNKAKAPGGPSLFDLVGLDVFMSQSKIQHIARHINFEPLYALPKTPYIDLDTEIDRHYAKIFQEQIEKPLDYTTAQAERTKREMAENVQLPPSQIYDPQPDPTGKVTPKGDLLPGFHFGSIEKPFLFFITMQIPTYAPSYMGSTVDGEGMNLVWYCRATPETQRDLLRADPVNPAVALLKKYLLANPVDRDYQFNMDRFKNIPRLVNVDEFDFAWSINKVIKQYNAKPFLTRPQGILHRGPGYANFDLDIHQFCYMAKKVLNGFIPMMSRVILDWCFTVEGHTDDELPESTIAQFRVFKIEAKSFPSWEETVKELEKAKTTPGYDSTHATGLVTPLNTIKEDPKGVVVPPIKKK